VERLLGPNEANAGSIPARGAMTNDEHRKHIKKGVAKSNNSKPCPNCGKKLSLEVEIVNNGSKQFACRRCGYRFIIPDAG
jgi:ribosomal protein L37AE/L43A